MSTQSKTIFSKIHDFIHACVTHPITTFMTGAVVGLMFGLMHVDPACLAQGVKLPEPPAISSQSAK